MTLTVFISLIKYRTTKNSTRCPLPPKFGPDYVVQGCNGEPLTTRCQPIVRRDATYDVISAGVRWCRTRNTMTSRLYSVRYFTGNQWSGCSAAVMLRQSPRLTPSTTLAAERCTISRRGRLRSEMPYRTVFQLSKRDVTGEWTRGACCSCQTCS